MKNCEQENALRKVLYFLKRNPHQIEGIFYSWSYGKDFMAGVLNNAVELGYVKRMTLLGYSITQKGVEFLEGQKNDQN